VWKVKALMTTIELHNLNSNFSITEFLKMCFLWEGSYKACFCVYIEEDERTELENLMCLEQKFADWEKQLKSKLAVSGRISEKTKTDKKKLTKEMQKQVL
jgi:hypothetical protein